MSRRLISFSFRMMTLIWAHKAQSSNLKEVIQEKEADINALSLNLERAKWMIKYLEKRNKQLGDQQTIMELQNI